MKAALKTEPPIDSKSLKKLKRKWEQRLYDDGFRDIERENGEGERVLKQYASNSFRNADELEREQKLEFFLQCSSMMAQTKFPRVLDHWIMEMFCEGVEKKEMKALLAEAGIKRGADAIQDIIRKYLILFGLYGAYGKYLCGQRTKRN